MKILVAPMNWGLGHASRCVPLVKRFLDEGHEVILGGDGESLILLRKHFPKQRYVYLAPLQLSYSSGKRQVWAMIKALPQLIRWAIQDHTMLQTVLREEPIDRVVSDNRFGLYTNHQSPITNNKSETVYITHQLHIMLPRGWRWVEPLVERLHARIYSRFDQVWVPDYEDINLSLAGELSHLKNPKSKIKNLKYIGFLSRLTLDNASIVARQRTDNASVVAVLSGLEPQRTLLEKQLIARYQDTEERVLIVQGLLHRPNTRFKRGNITIVPYLNDAELTAALLGADHIIARSGYSTIMDLAALGLLKNNDCQISNLKSKIELIPTPGQPEQEYLADYILHSL